MSVSPDEKKIVNASSNGTITIWDLQTGKLQKTILTNEFERFDPHCHYSNLRITPNGKQVYIIKWAYRFHYVDRIICWDLENDKLPNSLTVTSSKDFPLLSSLDGNKIIYQSENSNLEVFNLQTEKIELRIPNSGETILKLIFSYDGNILVDCTQTRYLIFWDLATGKIKDKYKLKKAYPLEIANVKIALDSTTLIKLFSI